MVDEFEQAVRDRWVGAQVTRMHAERFRPEEAGDLKKLLGYRCRLTPGQVFEVVADVQRTPGVRIPLSGGWATLLHTYPSSIREPSPDLDFFARNEDTMIALGRRYGIKFVHEWGAWTMLADVPGEKKVRIDINHVDMIPEALEIRPPLDLANTESPILVVRPIRILAGKLARTWDRGSPRPTDILDISSYLLRSAKDPEIVTDLLEMLRRNFKAMKAFKLLGLPNSLRDLVDEDKVSQVWSVLKKYSELTT